VPLSPSLPFHLLPSPLPLSDVRPASHCGGLSCTHFAFILVPSSPSPPGLFPSHLALMIAAVYDTAGFAMTTTEVRHSLRPCFIHRLTRGTRSQAHLVSRKTVSSVTDAPRSWSCLARVAEPLLLFLQGKSISALFSSSGLLCSRIMRCPVVTLRKNVIPSSTPPSNSPGAGLGRGPVCALRLCQLLPGVQGADIVGTTRI
jgi:hypothetical protein